MKHLPPKLQRVYDQHYQNVSEPGFEELQDIFLATLQRLESIFLVLDALDECTGAQRADLCDFFARVIESSNETDDYGRIKLFVASRKEPDIERAFLRKSFPTIEVEAKKVDSDIRRYVTAQLEERLGDGSLTLKNTMLKDKILDVLTTKAGGMYVSLHYNILYL